MSIDLGNLATWFSERPKWLQDAARRLLQAGELTDADRAELVIHCKREAGIKVPERPELDQEKLTTLLRLKYHDSIADAVADLGRPEEIGEVFSGFQQYLYQQQAVA
jgi:hypothetical protein